MNGLNNSSDEVVECPLCMEPLEVDDLNFFPCTCGYQICRFCWHRIRTDENELCPACRKEYPENPADFTPLTQEEMIAFKSQKRQRDQQRKQKITENRKHLSNVRVVQRNLVFVVGLPPRLADADVLKKHEYFGKFGKIHKVVINPSTTYAGVQGPSASAYVTYVQNCDALRAIQSVNNIMIDGRLIKTSLGTTKYCSHFMKNQQCPKADCMYLHELGDPEASFTKEEMHQGKHQEYEKRLHDALIATSGSSSSSVNGMGNGSIGNGSGNGGNSVGGNGGGSSVNNATTLSASSSNGTTATTTTATTSQVIHSAFNKNVDGGSNKLSNGNGSSLSSLAYAVSLSASSSMSTSSTSSSSTSSSSSGSSAAAVVAGANGANVQKDAWPSLSASPTNNSSSKENVTASTAGTNNSNSRHTKNRREKKQEKNGKNKTNKNNNNNNNSQGSNNSNSNLTTNKENFHPHTQSNGAKESITTTTTSDEHSNSGGGKTKAEKSKTSSQSGRNQKKEQQRQLRGVISADDEVKLIQASDMQQRDRSNSSRNTNNDNDTHCNGQSDAQRPVSTSSSQSSDNTSTLSESTSGKSSPSTFPEQSNNEKDAPAKTTQSNASTIEFETHQQQQSQQQLRSQQQQQHMTSGENTSDDNRSDLYHTHQQSAVSPNSSNLSIIDNPSSQTADTLINKEMTMTAPLNGDVIENNVTTIPAITKELQQNLNPATEQQTSINANSLNSIADTTAALSKLNIFDDNNSFFSSTGPFQQSMLLKNKLEAEMRPTQLNSAISSHLPDLLNGVDGFQNNTANTNEWEEAFKNIMLRTNKQLLEEQLTQPTSPYQQHQHHQQHLHQQQEEFLRIQELQKRNNLLNNIGLSQMNGPHNDFPNNFSSADLSRLSQAALIQHQQQLLQQQQQERLQQSAAGYSADHLLGSSLFGTNMSKFFDFHKNQQQQQQLHQQQFLVNGHSSLGGSNGISSPLGEHLRMSSLLENNRINSQFLDKPLNGLVSSQQQQQQLQQVQQLQKQRLLGNKYDPLLPPQQQPQLQSQNQQQTQVRVPNQFAHSPSVEDDLGFDPFIETQKALAELMENEMVQQQTPSSSSGGMVNSTAIAKKILQQQQQQHQLAQQHHQQHTHLLDNLPPRARMPPPGFNHMNAFGFGVPRAQNTSKILPFMNMNGNAGSGAGAGANGQQPTQTQTQLQMPPNSWNAHMAAASMQQQQQQQQQHNSLAGDPQLHMNLQQNQNGGGSHTKGYSNNNDWTAMDPAILSFRQFSSFPQQQPQQPQPPLPHHSHQDLFMQHVAQQQQQQQQQQNGFGGAQAQLHAAGGGINIPNSALLNQSNSAASASAAQMNLSHTNWLSTEQSLFMNSLANGFNNNNFDKFSIPLPPGIHPNNLNKQQKTECIN